MYASRQLRRGCETMTRSTVVNGDATLGGTGSAPFAVEILQLSLSDGFGMTRPSGATIKRDCARMNRVVNSILRYVPGHRRCAFAAQNPSRRPRRPSFLLSSTEV